MRGDRCWHTAGRTDGLDGGRGEGPLSPHPDLFSLFLDTYILNNRSVNGCLGRGGGGGRGGNTRKCLFLGNHLDSWESYSFVKIILRKAISDVKQSS